MFSLTTSLHAICFQVKGSLINSRTLKAIAKVESNFNPKARNKDSLGLMQIQLATARFLGMKGSIRKQLFNPKTNLKYAVMYLNYLYEMFQGDVFKVLDAYNRGWGNVKSHPYKKDYLKHKYVKKVLSALKELGPEKDCG